MRCQLKLATGQLVVEARMPLPPVGTYIRVNETDLYLVMATCLYVYFAEADTYAEVMVIPAENWPLTTPAY